MEKLEVWKYNVKRTDRITYELTAFCSDKRFCVFISFFFCIFFFFSPSPFRGRDERQGEGEKEKFPWLQTTPVSKKDRRRQRTEEEKQDKKTCFFFVFFHIFFCGFFFLNYSTIKRGTKSHQFPLVLYIYCFEKLEEEEEEEENIEEERKKEGGVFRDGHSGLQDGDCEQKALFRDNL